MKYTLKDLSPFSEVVSVSSHRFNHFPSWLQDEIRNQMTHDEIMSLLSYLEDRVSLYKASGEFVETPEIIVDVLKHWEILHGYFERAIPRDQLFHLYPVDHLKPEHVKILRDLELPKLAQAIEDGLASRAKGPETPYSWNDLAPIAEAARMSSQRYFRLPPELIEKVFAKQPDETVKRFNASAERAGRIMVLSDFARNPDILVERLRNHETLHGFFENDLPESKWASLYPADGLTSKHIEILRALGLPKIAQAFENSLKAKQAAPEPMMIKKDIATRKSGFRRRTTPYSRSPA